MMMFLATCCLGTGCDECAGLRLALACASLHYDLTLELVAAKIGIRSDWNSLELCRIGDHVIGSAREHVALRCRQ